MQIHDAARKIYINTEIQLAASPIKAEENKINFERANDVCHQSSIAFAASFITSRFDILPAGHALAIRVMSISSPNHLCHQAEFSPILIFMAATHALADVLHIHGELALSLDTGKMCVHISLL